MKKFWMPLGVAGGIGALVTLYLAFDYVIAGGDETRPGPRAYRWLGRRGLVPNALLDTSGEYELVELTPDDVFGKREG
jgi:hypothetical protein